MQVGVPLTGVPLCPPIPYKVQVKFIPGPWSSIARFLWEDSIGIFKKKRCYVQRKIFQSWQGRFLVGHYQDHQISLFCGSGKVESVGVGDTLVTIYSCSIRPLSLVLARHNLLVQTFTRWGTTYYCYVTSFYCQSQAQVVQLY